MVKEEVEELIIQCKCRRRTWPLDLPHPDTWVAAASRLGCSISPDYQILFEVSLRFWVGLDLFGPIRDGGPEGHESFLDACDDEMANNPLWDPEMIPICAVGNGDYFSLLIEPPVAEKVYYVYHENGTTELLNPSVEEWIRSLPEFLAG